MANQIFCFQIKRTPWMAQFFPNCVIRVVSSGQPSRNFFINHHGEFFSCILLTGSYGALRARAILLIFEQIYSCLFIPNCTRNHVPIRRENVIKLVPIDFHKRLSLPAERHLGELVAFPGFHNKFKDLVRCKKV